MSEHHSNIFRQRPSRRPRKPSQRSSDSLSKLEKDSLSSFFNSNNSSLSEFLKASKLMENLNSLDFLDSYPPKPFAKNTLMTTSTNSWGVGPDAQYYYNVGRISEIFEFQRMKEFINLGLNQVTKTYDVLCKSNFVFPDWITKSFNPFYMNGTHNAYAFWNNQAGPTGSVYLEFRFRGNNLNVTASGTVEAINGFTEWISKEDFRPSEVMVDWVFGPNYREMEEFHLPIVLKDEIPGAYPWMKDTIQNYTKTFIDSDECVLVLKGSPGTGKTTFLKHLVKAAGTSAVITYDSHLLNSDGFFASFLTRDDANLLIIEDADDLLQARAEGNKLMEKLLNASDGMISFKHKKLIFSTNLPNVSSIDPALLRKGRCFDILDFRRLTRDEAKIVAKNYYGHDNTALDGKDFSLAEITNLKADLKIDTPIQKLGFL